MTRTISVLLISLISIAEARGVGADAGNAETDEEGAVERFQQIRSAVEPRRGLTILVRVGNEPWTGKRAVYPLRGQEIALKIKERGFDDIRWYMIFADLTRNYKNANHPWEENPYEWVGFDEIQYHRIELKVFGGHGTIRPFSDGRRLWQDVEAWFRSRGYRGRALDFYSEGRGSFWFQIEARKDGVWYRSPGVEDVTERGLPRSVTRISIRDGEGYLGYVTAFFNVPGLFGSVLSQSRNHIGADCADVLMAAWAKWRKKPLKKNYNVQMMTGKFRRVSDIRITEGRPDEIVRWREQVRPGDFIAVSYGSEGKRFHHVGALYEDANQDGVLDPGDLVIHAGPDPLHLSRLASGAFDGRVLILRP